MKQTVSRMFLAADSAIGILVFCILGTGSAWSASTRIPSGGPALAGVTVDRDVTYLTPDRAEKLDLYLPANRPKDTLSPAVVIIHGGGWSGGDKGQGREINIGTTLAKAGYVCASVNYRLTAHERWPTNLFDCKNAVRFLRKNADQYHIDPEHIGVIGGSAGGHLSLMVAFTTDVPELEPTGPYPGISDRVQAVVDMYGLSNLLTSQKTDAEGNPTGAPGPHWGIFGDKNPITDADRILASPVSHLSPHVPPVLILHGTKDTTIDRNQSIELDKKLTEQKVEHQLILIPGIGHTFDLQTWAHKPLPMDLRPVVIGFFDRYLKVPVAGEHP